MASKRNIIEMVNTTVGSTQYDAWRIGITHDPKERERHWSQQQSTTRWSVWLADSLSDAQDIENFFITLGMNGGTGGDVSPGKPIYIYVF